LDDMLKNETPGL